MATPQSIAQKLANISQRYYAGGDYAQASREIDNILSELNPTDTERSYVKQQLLGEDTGTVSGYLKQTGQELSDVGSNLVPLAKQSFANTLTEFGRPNLSPEDQKLFESQNNQEVDQAYSPLMNTLGLEFDVKQSQGRFPDVFELPGMAARGFRDYVLEPTGLMDLYREEVKPRMYQTGQEMITENAEDYGQIPMQRTFLGQAARSIPESIAPTAIGIGTGVVGGGIGRGVGRKAADVTARVVGTGAALSSAPALLASEANRSIDAHPVWQELTKNMPDVEKNNLRQKLRSANNSAIFDEKFLNTMQLIQAGTALPQGSFFARLTADVLAEAAEEGFDDQPIVATVVNQNLQNYLRNTNNPLQNDPTLITNRWDWIKANPEAVLEGAAMGAVASLPVSGSVGLVEQVASPSINRPVGNPEEIQQMTNKIFENIQTLPGNNDALAEDLVTRPEFQDTIRGINNKVDSGRELQPKERKISKWYQEYVSKSLERSQQFLESTNQTESDVLAEPERQLAEGVGDEFNYFTNLENQAKRATAKTEPTITDSPFGMFSSNRQEDLPGIPPLQQSPDFEPLQETEVDEETARQTQEEQRLIDFYRQAARPEPSVSQQLDLPIVNIDGTNPIQPVQTEEEQAFAELDQQLAEQQPLTQAELEQIERELDEIMPFTDRGFDLESDEVSPIQQVDEEIAQEIQDEADMQQQIEDVALADDRLRSEVNTEIQTADDQGVEQAIFDETQQQAQTLTTNLEGIRNRVERDADILRQIDQMESEETTQAVLADDQAVADAESETFQEDITQDPAAGLQELQDARDIEAEMDQSSPIDDLGRDASAVFDLELTPENTKKSEVLNGVKINPDTKRGQEVLKQRELEVLKDVMSQYFPEASEVVVLDTTEELKQRENIPADVTGIEGATFPKGDGYVVYLIGENLKGKDLRSAIENGVKIYHHESIGHAGLMQMLGSRYNDFANKVYKNRQTEIDNFIKTRYPNGLPDDTPVRRASEWLAINFTEQGVEQLGVFDTVTAVLRGETSDVGIKRKYQQVYNTLAAGRKPEIVIRPTGRASTETTDAPEEEAPNVELPASLQNVPRPTEKQIKKAQEKLKNVENAEETRAKTITEAETAASELTPQELSVPTNNKVNKVRDKLAEISVLDEMLGYSKAVVEAEQTQQDDMLGYSAPDEAAVSRTEFNLAKKFNTNSAKDTQILDTAINNTRKKLAALDAKIQEANQKDGASDNQLDNLNKLKVRLQALKNIRGEQPQQTSQTQVSQSDQTSQETSQQADQDDDVVTLSPMGSFSSNRIASVNPEEQQQRLADIRQWEANRKAQPDYQTPEEQQKNDPEYKASIEKLRSAAQQLAAREISQEEYQRQVAIFDPIQSLGVKYNIPDGVPPPATTEEIRSAVGKKAEDKGIIGFDTQLPDGELVGLRLDIPAYRFSDVWVPTVHEGETPSTGGAVRGYAPTARILGHPNSSDGNKVIFFNNPSLVKAALNIAQGKINKTPVARIFGSWANQNPDEMFIEAQEILKNPSQPDGAWIEVGMNPQRASYFYDKADGRPLKEADEVLQVGALVLARNPVYGNPSEYVTTDGVSFSSNRQQTPPPNTTGTQQERGLRRALDGLNKAFDPRALVPDREFFEKILQRAKGVQNEYVEAGQKLASVMMEANEAEQKLIYDYMKDRDADPNTIPDRQVRGFIGKQIRKRFNRENPTLREAAVEAKEIIEGIGRDLVRQGLLDPQTFKARSGQYLPRLYLKYLDDNNLFSGAGGSLKVSPQGYLKQMRDIDPMIRTMLLGEIKSPGYLVGQTIMQAGQDVARMDFLKEVAQNKQWVLPSSQVKLNIAKLTNDIIQRNNLGPQLIQEGLPAATRQAADRNVSPEFLEAEAKRLQDQILPSKPLGSAQRTLVQEIISEYSNLANKARADIPNYAEDKYRQLPNTNRYGDLRGAYVLKEIADVVAGDPFFTNEDSSFKSLERGVATINTLFKWGATAAYPVAWVNNVISNSAMMAFGGLPIHQNLHYRAKAIKEMATNGRRYQDYKDQGLTLSTFAADELGRLQSNFKTQLTPKDRRIMYDDSWFPNLKSADGYARVANIFGKIFNGFGNIYQSLEVIDKLALAMYLEDKGANVAGIPFANEDKLTPQEAMREANKWLYDYSDVTPPVRKLRKSLLGAPFLTWTYKTVDRLARMMGDPKASLRAAAYYGILYSAMSMKMADLDDDERDAFYEGLPDWYRKKGIFAVPMPEKDENDRIQIKDYSYAAPHAFIYQFFNTMFDDRYPIFEAFVDLGFTNHPILQQIIEQSANKNLYTGKPLYSEFDTGGQKAKKALLHFADGVLPQLIAPSGWGKQMLETVSGDPNLLSGLGLDSATLDREGKPKLTPTQILGKADLTGLSQAEFPQSMLDVLTLPLNSPLLLNPANRPANIEDSLKFRRSRIIEELRSDRYRERTAIKQQTTAEGKRQKKLEFLEKRKRLMEGLKKVNRALKNLPDFKKPVRITSIEAVPQ